MQLSEDQIYALAPDESSKKSGKELANPSKWVSKGVNAEALWGECQGSGSKPYQTQIDVANLAFKCSCPSRKFPCKHGLGLLLLYTRQASSFTTNEAPAWVTDWINRRTEKEEKKVEKKEKPVDESAQAKRQQAREQKVANGIEELLLWIKDMIRNGIIDIPEKKTAFWDTMAKRMVDAQAPGLAGLVRELSTINFYKEGWQNKFTDQLAKLYLLTQAYKNIGSLSEELQADIKSLVGFTQNQEELKTNTGIQDDWFVLGKQVTQEDQLTVERNWLYGTHTKRMALVLQFFVRNQIPTVTLTPGMSVQAELIFFPSALPLRALLKQQFGTVSSKQITGFKNWEEVAKQEANYNQLQPFVSSYPFIVDEVTPVHFNNSWWLQDAEKRMMKIEEGFMNTWNLLAISGGSSLSLAVMGKENNYTPLGAWQNGSYKILS